MNMIDSKNKFGIAGGSKASTSSWNLIETAPAETPVLKPEGLCLLVLRHV